MILADDLKHAGRGLLMGGADIIPGVSGGTLALILGIYQRLVTAISHFDIQLLRLLVGQQWAAAARHIDLRFLLALGMGILAGIVGLASLMHYLLEHQRPYTLAAFFGLIAASSWLVARLVQTRSQADSLRLLAIGAAAAGFAFWLTSRTQVVGDSSLAYAFLCGAVAICAMILPGISGAYILVLLGMYQVITGLIVRVRSFTATFDDLLLLFVFASGCAVGLITFSKVLKSLLARFESMTLAALCGFMIGSLRCVWPFQIDLTPEIEKMKLKQFELFVPDELNRDVFLCTAIAIAAAAAVLLLDYIARRPSSTPSVAAVESGP